MNSSEQVVRVRVKINPTDEKKVTRYVIKDTDEAVEHIARFRSNSDLSDFNAWTSFLDGARMFKTRKAAKVVLDDMRVDREARKHAPPPASSRRAQFKKM